jgi:hypothetical protein
VSPVEERIDHEQMALVAKHMLSADRIHRFAAQDLARAYLALLSERDAREDQIGKRANELRSLAERNMKTATGEGYTYWQGYRDGVLAAVEPLPATEPAQPEEPSDA